LAQAGIERDVTDVATRGIRTGTATRTGSTAGIVPALVAGVLLARPVARVLRWSWLGSVCAMWGLGAALSLAFAGRLGRLDAGWDPQLIRVCLSGPTSAWFEAEGILNLVLLVPFGIGLHLASHNGTLSSAIIVITAGQ
jgi:hypothetical protein